MKIALFIGGYSYLPSAIRSKLKRDNSTSDRLLLAEILTNLPFTKDKPNSLSEYDYLFEKLKNESEELIYFRDEKDPNIVLFMDKGGYSQRGSVNIINLVTILTDRVWRLNIVSGENDSIEYLPIIKEVNPLTNEGSW